MSNAIAIIGFLAFLCAVGYGIFISYAKRQKKKNIFQKSCFGLFSSADLSCF